MIQIYHASTGEYINRFKNFKDTDFTGITNFVKQGLRDKDTKIIRIQKWSEVNTSEIRSLKGNL